MSTALERTTRVTFFMMSLLVAGCATISAPTAQLPVEAAVEARTYQQKLHLGGRITVRYQGPNGPEVLPGSFEWNQDPDQTSVTLMSPLGQTVARIDVTAAGATLMQAGQPPRSAPDVNALTAQTLGWPLPVSGLREWLQGFAIDANGNRFVAAPQSPSVTTQDGWQIEYPGWEEDGGGMPRPRRIDLSRQTTEAGYVAIRIVIDTWQTP